MLPEKRNPRAAGTVQGTSETVFADGSQHTTLSTNFKTAGALADLIVRRLAARHGLTLAHAAVVASLAGLRGCGNV
ncbi:MAG: hypothetical protein ACF8MF_06890 [Phycisphaerales bacterium JB052]